MITTRRSLLAGRQKYGLQSLIPLHYVVAGVYSRAWRGPWRLSIIVQYALNGPAKAHITKAEEYYVSVPPSVRGFILLSFSSYRRRRSRSTHPPLGNAFSHWLCRCTENTLPRTLSSPPPSSRPMPNVHFPFDGSAVNGSGSRLSKRHERPSVKQNGRTLKGGISASRSRLQSLR